MGKTYSIRKVRVGGSQAEIWKKKNECWSLFHIPPPPCKHLLRSFAIPIFKFRWETHRMSQTGLFCGHSLSTVRTSPTALMTFIEQSSDFQPWNLALQLLWAQAQNPVPPQTPHKNCRSHSPNWWRCSLMQQALCWVIIRSSTNSLVHFKALVGVSDIFYIFRNWSIPLRRCEY